MSLLRSSIIVGLFSAFGIVLNLILSVFTARLFGSSTQMDTYLSAIIVPSYFITIIGGALSVTFIPVFAEFKNTDSQKAWSTVSVFINFTILCSVAFVLAGIILAAPIIKILTPGFTIPQQKYAALLLQIYFPVLIFSVINELLASIYFSHNKFVVPLLNKIITPGITILFILFFGRTLNVMSLVFASVIASMIQCFMLAIGILRNKTFSFVYINHFYNRDVKKILRLMTPLIAGMLFYKIIPVFDRFILSSLPAGSISNLNYASKLQSTIILVISSAVTLPLFPLLSKIGAEKDYLLLKSNLSKVISTLYFIAIPFAVLLAILGETFIRVLFERGAFLPDNTHEVYQCFFWYMISLPVVAVGGVVSQGLYVLRDTRTIAIVGVFETMLYIFLCFMFIGKYHIMAIPISYGIYFSVSVLLIGGVFRKKIGMGGGGKLLLQISKHTSIALFIGLLAFTFRKNTPQSYIWDIGLFIGLLVLFFVISRLLNVSEAKFLLNKIYAKGKN